MVSTMIAVCLIQRDTALLDFADVGDLKADVRAKWQAAQKLRNLWCNSDCIG